MSNEWLTIDLPPGCEFPSNECRVLLVKTGNGGVEVNAFAPWGPPHKEGLNIIAAVRAHCSNACTSQCSLATRNVDKNWEIIPPCCMTDK